MEDKLLFGCGKKVKYNICGEIQDLYEVGGSCQVIICKECREKELREVSR